MNYKFILVLCLHIIPTYSAPMNVQVIPLPYEMQPQNLQNLQMQLQNPFIRQNVPNLQSPYMYQQPMMVLIPSPPAEADDRYTNLNDENPTNSLKGNTGHIDDKKDAIVLEAEPNFTDMDLKKAVVLMPNGARFSIGQIISYIPFLPIEINVPDTINWISGLFPGNWFGRPVQNQGNAQRLSNKGPMPFLVLPRPMI